MGLFLPLDLILVQLSSLHSLHVDCSAPLRREKVDKIISKWTSGKTKTFLCIVKIDDESCAMCSALQCHHSMAAIYFPAALCSHSSNVDEKMRLCSDAFSYVYDCRHCFFCKFSLTFSICLSSFLRRHE